MDETGKHLIVDIYTKNLILKSPVSLKKFLKELIMMSGNTILSCIEKEFQPQGYSINYLLAESHASIHTYPERNYLALDIYSCGDGKPEKTIDLIIETLEPYKYKFILIERGKDTKIIELK